MVGHEPFAFDDPFVVITAAAVFVSEIDAHNGDPGTFRKRFHNMINAVLHEGRFNFPEEVYDASLKSAEDLLETLDHFKERDALYASLLDVIRDQDL